MKQAEFDAWDHCTEPGWASYSLRKVAWRCRRRGHQAPSYVPEPANGFSPSNYDRCGRCRQHMHWYVVGQHRFGGLDGLNALERAGRRR